jgi:drug/metabolite transporter (DMT)-like permease
VLSSALGDAFGSFYASRFRLPDDPLLSSALQMVIIGPVLLAAGFLRGEQLTPSSWHASGLVALLFLIGPGSIVAYSSFVWLITRVPPSLATTYTYVNPIVAVILGFIVLD